MKLTIVRLDNTVVKDGKPHWVNCASVPAYVTVIQWDDNYASGHVEFVNDGRGQHLPNLIIKDVAPYQHLIEAWNEAEAREQEKKLADVAAQADGEAETKRLSAPPSP